MPISFFDLLADDGWEPLAFDPADPSFYWNDGGFMTTAPVDITATFDGAMWHSTNVEPAFKWRGRRIRAGFIVPKRHHNLRQLTIVVGGSIEVECGADDYLDKKDLASDILARSVRGVLARWDAWRRLVHRQ